MKIIRGLGGSLLWILGAVVGLVGLILCVTIILLPLGLPVLGLARRLIRTGVGLMLPKAVTHPVEELNSMKDGVSRRARGSTKGARKSSRKAAKRMRKEFG